MLQTVLFRQGAEGGGMKRQGCLLTATLLIYIYRQNNAWVE